jgi:glycerophosphoryl diester phosphodiesterase
MALAPENTLAAFRRAEALGVDVLEMDLRHAADDEIVVIHDETVDRTTNGQGRVRDMTLAELRELDAAYRFVDRSGGNPLRGRGITVPALADVLLAFPEARLNLEMKEFDPEQALRLCGVLRRFHAAERVLVSSFGHPPMAAFRGACPEVATGATRRETIAFSVLNRLRLGSLYHSPAVALQVPQTFRGRRVVTPELLSLARDVNLWVEVWTVNEEADMRRLLAMGVQAVLTDHPDRLLALLGRTAPSD